MEIAMGVKSTFGLATFGLAQHSDHPHMIHDFDLVRTLVAVEAEGRVIQSGALGTVVDISQTSNAYEIEFAEPVCCVLTMTRDQFTDHHR
jgi:hypothetical protein